MNHAFESLVTSGHPECVIMQMAIISEDNDPTFQCCRTGLECRFVQRPFVLDQELCLSQRKGRCLFQTSFSELAVSGWQLPPDYIESFRCAWRYERQMQKPWRLTTKADDKIGGPTLIHVLVDLIFACRCSPNRAGVCAAELCVIMRAVAVGAYVCHDVWP